MKRTWKRWGASLLAVIALLGLLSGCGGKSDSVDSLTFGWWIPENDARGTFYNSYDENPGVQWINNQYWSAQTGGLSNEKDGKQLHFSFQTPISGAERDNFNTMISTSDYPEIVDLSYASSPYQLYQEGHLLEITEYVEQYCPNYVALLEKNPGMKPFATVTDEDGKVHYYGLYNISDGVKMPWQGYMYRRDWVVKYAEPTEYVWDWDSAEVQANGHPAVTPLSAAVESGNLAGWKKNDVTKFEKSEGSNPEEDWTDNVIFPSGMVDPYTISDWEWMFEAFTKALAAEGFSNDTNAYCISLMYLGYTETGELISSFGGGGPMWYLDQEGNSAFGATGENFKTYLKCMNTWSKNGWLDTKFESRSSDMFYQINVNGYTRGMVGMWQGGIGDTGTAIRTTCSSEEGKKDAMVFGCSLPVNDVYGGDAQKYNIPDMLYQDPRLGVATGFTKKCEGKDLATLFTMINYLYSNEGATLASFGLSAEQYASMSFAPDLYAENGLTAGFTVSEQDGRTAYSLTVEASKELANAIKGQRMACSLYMQGNDEYALDRGYSGVRERTLNQWMKYEATAGIRDYVSLLSGEDTATYDKTRNYINDYMGQSVPSLIKDGLDGWDDFCARVVKYGPDKVVNIFQNYVK